MDHYHQTNPPTLLKSEVMGKQGTKKAPLPLMVQIFRKDLLWNPGPAKGGGGTAGGEYWWDGDLLLILVELTSEDFVRLVRVRADGDMVGFQDPDTGDDMGFGPDDIAWWAKIMDCLPNIKDHRPE